MAILTGSQGNLTFTSGDSIANIFLFQWQAQIVRQLFKTNRFGWSGTSRTPGAIIDAQGTATGWIQSTGKQPVPTGTVGDMTLLEETGQSYAFKAIIEVLDSGADAQTDQPQTMRLAFSMAAQSSTDTVV